MSRLFDAKDLFDPADDLVRARIGGLVQIDDPVAQMLSQGAGQWTRSTGKRGIVGGSDMELMVVLEQ